MKAQLLNLIRSIRTVSRSIYRTTCPMSSNQTLINSHNLCYCSSVDIAQCSCHRYQITTGIIPSKEHSNIKCNERFLAQHFCSKGNIVTIWRLSCKKCIGKLCDYWFDMDKTARCVHKNRYFIKNNKKAFIGNRIFCLIIID